MERPPVLKPDTVDSEIELKVRDDEVETAMLPTPEPITAAEKSVRDANNKLTAQASKRAKEQEFLAAYKAKQVRTRIKFVACAAIVMALFAASVSFIFSNPKSSIALARFQIAPLFACLGERDTAYYAMSEFSDKQTKKTPGLIEQRTKILDKAIAELESNGRPAIFTRLGAEQMLMKYGDRDTGLRYGDALIAKYPDLPSNYLWRAKTDLNNYDFKAAITEYKQATNKLDKLPAQASAWEEDLTGAVWACIDSGQINDAKQFISAYEKHGGNKNKYELTGLKSQVLLASCENIAAPELRKTSFWNNKLEAVYNDRITKAMAVASRMNYNDLNFEQNHDVYRYELMEQATILKGDKARFDQDARGSYTWDSMFRARMALSHDKPQEALNILAAQGYKKGYNTREINFLKAVALQKSQLSQESLAAIDKLLESSDRFESVSNYRYLPLLCTKAKTLRDLGRYQEAIAICDKILIQNPDSIEALLIKLGCYERLKDASAAAETSTTISNALAVWAKPVESGLDD